jgi:GTP-binding protein HflX
MRELILSFFETDMIDKVLLIPYTQGKVLGMIRERARVLEEKHEDEGTIVTIRAPEEVHAWIEKQLSKGS